MCRWVTDGGPRGGLKSILHCVPRALRAPGGGGPLSRLHEGALGYWRPGCEPGQPGGGSQSNGEGHQQVTSEVRPAGGRGCEQGLEVIACLRKRPGGRPPGVRCGQPSELKVEGRWLCTHHAPAWGLEKEGLCAGDRPWLTWKGSPL